MPVLFPLRSNAHALITGPSIATVRRCIKVAALLHDQVVLDAGAVHIIVGTKGGHELRIPPGKGPVEGWQTPRERGFPIGKEPLLMIGDGRIHMGTNLIVWRATFEPLKHELPRSYKWLEYAALGLYSGRKKLVSQLVHDQQQQQLAGIDGTPEGRVGQAIVKHAYTDAVMATGIEAAVNVDRIHQQVYQAHVERGQAREVFGEAAFLTLFPDVEALSWDDVDSLRKHRAWRHMRHLLQEIETVARSDAITPVEAEDQIRAEYTTRLAEAQDAVAGTIGRRAFVASLGVILGAFQVPGIHSPPRYQRGRGCCRTCCGPPDRKGNDPSLACGRPCAQAGAEGCPLVTLSEERPETGRRAGPGGGSLVLPPRPGWRDLAGRCWHARPQEEAAVQRS